MSIRPPVLPTAATYAVATPAVPAGKAPIAPPWAKGPAVAPANIGSALGGAAPAVAVGVPAPGAVPLVGGAVAAVVPPVPAAPLLPVAPACGTCSDEGAVGNVLTAQPCPDCLPEARCTAANPACAAPEAVPMVDFTALLETARKQAEAAVQAQEVLAAKVREHQSLAMGMAGIAALQEQEAALAAKERKQATGALMDVLTAVPTLVAKEFAAARTTHCTLGVGCESGVCYAMAHGRPEMCGAQEEEVTTHADDTPAQALLEELQAEEVVSDKRAPVGALGTRPVGNVLGFNLEGARPVFDPADFELLHTDEGHKVPHEIYVQTRIVGGTRLHVTMQGYVLRPAAPTGKRGRRPNPTRVMGSVEMYHLDIAEGYNVGMVRLLENYMERCYADALTEVRENVKLGVLWAEPTYTLRQTTRPDLMLWQLQQGAMAVGMVQ